MSRAHVDRSRNSHYARIELAEYVEGRRWR